MKKYYKVLGYYYCVTYYKNGHIKSVVKVVESPEKQILYISGKDFSRPFLKRCLPSTRDEFLKHYIAIACLFGDAIGSTESI